MSQKMNSSKALLCGKFSTTAAAVAAAAAAQSTEVMFLFGVLNSETFSIKTVPFKSEYKMSFKSDKYDP